MNKSNLELIRKRHSQIDDLDSLYKSYKPSRPVSNQFFMFKKEEFKPEHLKAMKELIFKVS